MSSLVELPSLDILWLWKYSTNSGLYQCRFQIGLKALVPMLFSKRICHSYTDVGYIFNKLAIRVYGFHYRREKIPGSEFSNSSYCKVVKIYNEISLSVKNESSVSLLNRHALYNDIDINLYITHITKICLQLY